MVDVARVMRIALALEPPTVVAADAQSVVGAANDAAAVPLASPDAATSPALSAGGCKGCCVTAPSTSGVPLITVAGLSLALAFARGRRSKRR